MKRIILALVFLLVAGSAFAMWKLQGQQGLICRFVLGFEEGPYTLVPDVPIEYIDLHRVSPYYWYLDIQGTDGVHYIYQFDHIRAGMRLNLEE